MSGEQGYGPTVAEQIEELRMELRLVGFAAAKEIARLLGQPSGVMECPLCQEELLYSTAACNV